jgi:hypothetical protein
MNSRIYLISGVLGVITLITLSGCVWYVQRDIHYSFSYGRMVNRDIETHLAPLNKRLTRMENILYELSNKG